MQTYKRLRVPLAAKSPPKPSPAPFRYDDAQQAVIECNDRIVVAEACELHQQQQADTALLRQVLEDICGAKLCEVNSMSSRAEARRLLDKATNALRKRLGETK